MNRNHYRERENVIRLNLACGRCIVPSYVNIDIRDGPGVDLVCDVRELPYGDNSVDLIYASHILDHFGRDEWLGVLRHWYNKLKLDGILRVAVGDFTVICEHYMKTRSLKGLVGLVVGGQRHEHDQHGMIFDYKTLALELYLTGFRSVHRYDWRQVEPGILGIDDYSQAHLPHMDKEHGQLMSLNVEAGK